MRRPLLLGSALALVASTLLIGSSPAQAQGLASYRFLPVQVFGRVAVGMPDERTVLVQHLDPATGEWDAPSTLVHTRGRVSCGDLESRASAGGVALIVECDTPYYEDQAPAHSLALASRDGRSWSRTTLPGEAYRAPAVAPGGAYAAWLVGETGQYVEWAAATGFAAPERTTYRFDSGGETPVVDDAGTGRAPRCGHLDKLDERWAGHCPDAVVSALGPTRVPRAAGISTSSMSGGRVTAPMLWSQRWARADS